MTPIEIRKQISDGSLLPIEVDSLVDDDDAMEFVGTFPEYVAAAKALQASAIFLETLILSEDFFVEDDEDFEEVDLCELMPRLASFKVRIGELMLINLLVMTPTVKLTFTVEQDWVSEFRELRSEAMELAQQLHRSEVARRDGALDAKKKVAVDRLKSLIADQNFVRLSTQAAMRAFAIDRIPELVDLTNDELRREVANLKADVEAKGLGRKTVR